MPDNHIKDIFAFCLELEANNSRDWFNAHKEQYTALRGAFVADVQRLVDLLAVDDTNLRGTRAADCVYRIYRDVRFSADKSPYKTYFSANIGPGGRKSELASYYVHLDPHDAMLCCGMWCPAPVTLRRMRSLIDACGDELQAAITGADFASRYRLEPFGQLKRVPAGYAQDHPYAGLLRLKDYTFASHVGQDFFTGEGDWVGRAAECFRAALPLSRFLNSVLI